MNHVARSSSRKPQYCVSQGTKLLSVRRSWSPSCWQSVARPKSDELLKHEPPVEGSKTPFMWVLHAEKTCLQNETGLQIQGTQCYQEKDQHAATCKGSLAPSAQHLLVLMEASTPGIPIFLQIFKDQRVLERTWHQASGLEYQKNFIVVS